MIRLIRSTFAIPALIAVLSLVGLIAALTGDGARDVLSWAALAMPVAAVPWARRRAARLILRSPTKVQP